MATDDSPCSSAQRIFISGRIGQQPEAGRTAIVVLVDDTPAAVFAVADRLRPGARVTVAALSSLTGRSPVLLTGDNPRARRPAGRLTPIAGVAALGMAFARVYIAAHYPTDVAVGLALGAAVALVVYLIADRLLASAVAAIVASDSVVRPLLTSSPSRQKEKVDSR